mgnify:CR=1 FL=1
MAVVAFYFVVSIATVFLNKFILSSSEHKFDQPLAMTWFQLVFALLRVLITYPLNKYAKYTTINIALIITFYFLDLFHFSNFCQTSSSN